MLLGGEHYYVVLCDLDNGNYDYRNVRRNKIIVKKNLFYLS
jgi:hypothetical protein